jgi:hypothetical protein
LYSIQNWIKHFVISTMEMNQMLWN